MNDTFVFAIVTFIAQVSNKVSNSFFVMKEGA
jgi:hypothetical protein